MVAGRKPLAFSGGGYFRLFPLPMIRWGVEHLNRQGQPAVVYLHPREFDPTHPRLQLPLLRTFKSYVRLDSTEPKLRDLLSRFTFQPLLDGLPAEA